MPDQREQNQALIVGIYEAAKGDATAKAEVIARALELHNVRQTMLDEYSVFVDGFSALHAKAFKTKPISPEMLVEMTKQASKIPIPQYDPLYDFGVMADIFEAAVNGDFNTMFRHAANALLPIDKAKKDAGSVRRAIAVLEIFRGARDAKQRKYALLRLRVYKGTLTNIRHKWESG